MRMQTLKPDDLIVKTLTALFNDAGNLNLDSRGNRSKDLNTILNRFKNEGLGFITKTLPKFGKHFDCSLKNGSFSTFPSFHKDRNGALPSFMKGLLAKVFDSRSGELLVAPSVQCISFIRQICYTFYKIEGDYPERLVDEIIKEFVKTDESLCECDSITPEKAAVIHQAQIILSRLFSDFDHSDIKPRPGPGQTADRRPHYGRYEPHVLYTKIHEVYPYYSNFYCNPTHLLDRVKFYRAMPKIQDGVSVLRTVPKDSRGPRIICMVPHEFMWYQQGLGRSMMEHIERHPISRGRVNFSDQSVNGRLALESSKSGEYATLDMKEASDRISINLIDILFDNLPIKKALLALTTPYCVLPDTSVMRFKKFAPMGSALCFPVMSIVHFALAAASLMINKGWSLRRATRSVYVYGDDIIVKTEGVDCILTDFPVYGLKFNQDKCFTTGKFRESCGIDAYDGINVTPIRIKRCEYSKSDAAAFVSIVATSNNLLEKGYEICSNLYEDIARSIYGDIPYTSHVSSLVGFTSQPADLAWLNYQRWVWDGDLQCMKIKGRSVRSKTLYSFIGGWEQLMRSQLHSEVDSLSYSGRDRVVLTRKWAPQSCV